MTRLQRVVFWLWSNSPWLANCVATPVFGAVLGAHGVSVLAMPGFALVAIAAACWGAVARVCQYEIRHLASYPVRWTWRLHGVRIWYTVTRAPVVAYGPTFIIHTSSELSTTAKAGESVDLGRKKRLDNLG